MTRRCITWDAATHVTFAPQRAAHGAQKTCRHFEYLKETATIRSTRSDRKNAAKKIKKLKKISATAKLRVNMAPNRAMFFFACAMLMLQMRMPDAENKTGRKPIKTGASSYKIYSAKWARVCIIRCLTMLHATCGANMQHRFFCARTRCY